MNILGIQFAPLFVPLERRLQTLAAATWILLMVFGNAIGPILTFYLLVYTKYWWLTALYLFWIWIIDKDIREKGGRQSTWVKSWSVWRYCIDYFSFRLEKLPGVELDPKKNYLFCCFPHGVICIGVFNAFATTWGGCSNYFPHHTPHIATLSQNYIIPFYRELALALGGIASSAKSIDYILRIPGGGHIGVVVVGGAAEAYYCKPGNYRVILKNRKGFVKLALKNGSPLVPMLSFGETDLFDQFDGPRLRSVQEAVRKRLGLAPVALIGRGFFQYSFGFIPRRRKVIAVVGIPLEVPKIQNPTVEQVDHYHAEFVKRLTQMFEEQKYTYLENPEDKHLVIE
ncbi:2-acylglycerol O-acyltransferase 2-like [Anoplophora glabripennis]|uniref:2-acylglycerol O-acyltransferase 2-like n=1 Tax=Anoplophora glabripennis TaxID=217634 RepID=UPI000875552C|nr:2-acylglycerol O-acyltransferase 2-like [Anoplophora glabripennis]XP_018568261.1 2-acylglycerol O-acyltransferase 2-like [Anoplophora glabripennis]